MSRHDAERLADILDAIAAIRGHLKRGTLDDGLVFDAVPARLIEIGEAVKGIDPEYLARESAMATGARRGPWTLRHRFA